MNCNAVMGKLVVTSVWSQDCHGQTRVYWRKMPRPGNRTVHVSTGSATLAIDTTKNTIASVFIINLIGTLHVCP